MPTTTSVRAQLHEAVLELVLGRIEAAATDAIVSAANTSLLGGGGVDGSIHEAAGPALMEECRRLGHCDTGDARITQGYQLKARYVIHAVGPIYGTPNADALLASAYRRSIALALVQPDIHSIAFPAISTGAYLYPPAEAAAIALSAVSQAAANQSQITHIQFILFEETPEMLDVFREALHTLAQERPESIRLM